MVKPCQFDLSSVWRWRSSGCRASSVLKLDDGAYTGGSRGKDVEGLLTALDSTYLGRSSAMGTDAATLLVAVTDTGIWGSTVSSRLRLPLPSGGGTSTPLTRSVNRA